MLGEFNDTQLPASQRQPLIEKLLAVFETNADAGLHSAAEWLLRKWGQYEKLQTVIEKLKVNEEQVEGSKGLDKKNWYINRQGQTFVIVDAREPFLMGSPESEPDHQPNDFQHRRHIGRHFAISTTEVTKAQYRAFQEAVHAFNLMNGKQLASIVRTDDSPQTAMTWYEAAWYCNWLSKMEGIPEEQWCYEPVEQENDEFEYGPGMKAKEKFWELRGYRLPTEAEWEFACRSAAVTSRYYGLSETLLPRYAWYLANGEKQTWPVSKLKPNDFGLFGMLGNAHEWCFDEYVRYPQWIRVNDAVEDMPTTEPVENTGRRVLRGGAYNNQPMEVRSAYRDLLQPDDRIISYGFRPARTYP